MYKKKAVALDCNRVLPPFVFSALLDILALQPSTCTEMVCHIHTACLK